jgi:predicted deacylase
MLRCIVNFHCLFLQESLWFTVGKGTTGLWQKYKKKKQKEAYIAQSSYWVRAPHSGSFKNLKKIGDSVKSNEVMAIISDPFGNDPHHVYSKEQGIIIGMSTIPLVNKGDAMIHIATFKDLSGVKENLEMVDTEFI